MAPSKLTPSNAMKVLFGFVGDRSPGSRRRYAAGVERGRAHGISASRVVKGGGDVSYSGKFVGVRIDWRGLRGSGLQVERRLEQWRIYNQGSAEEIATHFPGRRLEHFDQWVLKMIGSGELKIFEPGVFAKVATFSKAVARDVSTGRRRVPRPVRTRRMEECRACELYNLKKGTCRACGCVMTRKTHWSRVECPIGRWGIYEGEKE